MRRSATLYECENCEQRVRGPLTAPYECDECGHDKFYVLVDAGTLRGC